jgi:mycothiol synthase
MSLPAGYRIRAVDPAVDVPVAAAIQEACDLFDVGFADNEEIWVRDDWNESAHRGAWIVEDASGEPVAFANLAATDPGATIDAYSAILPPHRDALRAPVTANLEAESRRIAVGSPTMIVPLEAREGAGPVVEALGFVFSRAFWHMERTIDGSFRPVEPPAGVTLRPYRSPDDDRLGWELLEDTFAGHYSIDPQPFEAYQHDVLEHERWDPSLVAFAEADGEAVGIVVGEIIEEVGWIDDVGVRAAFRGRGVGRALLDHGFALLAGRGVKRIQLNVDSQNATGAIRLYERAGMTIRRSFDCYEKRLGPG